MGAIMLLAVAFLLSVATGLQTSSRPENMFTTLAPGQILPRDIQNEGKRSSYRSGSGPVRIRDSDIVLTRSQYNYLFGNRTGFKAEADRRRRWTDAVVPFVIDEIHFNDEQTAELHKAMETISQLTCIKFRPKVDSDDNWVKYTDNGSGCNSQLGMTGRGEQAVNLGEGCKWRGLYLHEIGHALGLIHEHQRPDRDEQVKVKWRLIKTDYLDAFTKYRADRVNDFGIKYDFTSIMHYEPEAFNDDQQITMIPRRHPWKVELMYRVYYKTMSFTDTKILNQMYQCGKRNKCNLRCPGNGYVGIMNNECACVTPEDIHNALCINEFSERECHQRVQAGDCNAGWAAAESHIKCRKACGSCPTFDLPESKYVKNLKVPHAKCIDRYHDPALCAKWASEGHCDRATWWMRRYCKKSCGACKWEQAKCRNYYKGAPNDEDCDELAMTGQCEANPLVKAGCQGSCQSCGFQVQGDCEDELEHCEQAALDGECDDNDPKIAAHRQRYCRKSCNSCFNGRGKCRDEIHPRECREAASQGLCRLEPAKYKTECRQSCDSCGFGVTDDSCEDIHPARACKPYAQKGTCDENKGYAWRFCASSCNKCEWAKNPPCEDFDARCPEWAAKGECDSNTQSMSTHCAKTCKTCDRFTPYGKCNNVDHDAFCEILKEDGRCESHATQMQRDCRRTCGHCEAPPIEKFWECKDLLPKNCEYWKGLGECERNPNNLKAFCHKTCGYCERSGVKGK